MGKSFWESGNSSLEALVENVNYEARVRYHEESVRELLNDRSNRGLEVVMVGQSRTVNEMSVQTNVLKNESRFSNSDNNIRLMNVRNMQRGIINQFLQGGNTLFRNIIEKPEQMFGIWRESLLKTCDGNLNLYSSQFARLKDVTVDRQYCKAKAKGGEEISKVLHQDENSEFYSMTKGCFQLTCPSTVPYYYFLGNINYLRQWVQSIASRESINSGTSGVISTFTIAIGRRDYANLYWTMNDWYATFLMMSFFEQNPNTTNIVLVDAHPMGKLDPVWSTLFQSSTRFSDLPLSTVFTDMVWGLQGYNSILNQYIPIGHFPPMLGEFRKFFLSRHHLEEPRVANCSEVSVLFVWRRDYLAHPRNPQGRVQRKIFNEQELIEGIKSLHPTYKVTTATSYYV